MQGSRGNIGVYLSIHRALFCIALASTWWAAALPARACTFFDSFAGATPPSESTLPSGEVYVALHYQFTALGEEGAYRVTNELDEDLPFTGQQRGDAMLLHFDTTGAEEVFVFGPDHVGQDALLTAYVISVDPPDRGTPTAPRVSVGETTCVACPDPGDSCCTFSDGVGRYSTVVSFTATQPGTILGWLDSDGDLAGVFGRTAYESSPATLSLAVMPPAGAPIVAMSVAGVVSSPVTWALERSGTCDAERPSGGGGCVAAPAGHPRASGVLWLPGLALLAMWRGLARRSGQHSRALPRPHAHRLSP